MQLPERERKIMKWNNSPAVISVIWPSNHRWAS
jgi:hypothetical protein